MTKSRQKLQVSSNTYLNHFSLFPAELINLIILKLWKEAHIIVVNNKISSQGFDIIEHEHSILLSIKRQNQSLFYG